MFGLGTIKCCSADKTLGDFEIKNIKKSKGVKEMLSEMVEEERNRKKVTSRVSLFYRDSYGSQLILTSLSCPVVSSNSNV